MSFHSLWKENELDQCKFYILKELDVIFSLLYIREKQILRCAELAAPQ